MTLAMTIVRDISARDVTGALSSKILKQEGLKLISALLKIGVVAKPEEVSSVLHTCRDQFKVTPSFLSYGEKTCTHGLQMYFELDQEQIAACLLLQVN